MIADPVRESGVSAAALAVALEAIPSPAFVLGPSGFVKWANRAGLHLCETQPALLESISAANGSGPGKFAVAPLRVAIGQDHYFVILSSSMNDPESRLAAAAEKWRLTLRQTEVLRCLVHGAANKEIAFELACVEGTVELHVTALLCKAGVKTRAQLMARFWLQL
jgi:DNA-binding CsgD family transcriptional regulator